MGKGLQYAYMELTEDVSVIVSASEIRNLELYFEAARKKDEGVSVDMESAENVASRIVYGGVKYDPARFESQKVRDFVMSCKGCTLINIDGEEGEFGRLVASVFKDIILYGDAEIRGIIPFAALMKSFEDFPGSYSVSLFPYTGGLVWEDAVNRPFILACRKAVEAAGLTVGDWKGGASRDEAVAAAAECDIVEFEGDDEDWDDCCSAL